MISLNTLIATLRIDYNSSTQNNQFFYGCLFRLALDWKIRTNLKFVLLFRV